MEFLVVGQSGTNGNFKLKAQLKKSLQELFPMEDYIHREGTHYIISSIDDKLLTHEDRLKVLDIVKQHDELNKYDISYLCQYPAGSTTLVFPEQCTSIWHLHRHREKLLEKYPAKCPITGRKLFDCTVIEGIEEPLYGNHDTAYTLPRLDLNDMCFYSQAYNSDGPCRLPKVLVLDINNCNDVELSVLLTCILYVKQLKNNFKANDYSVALKLLKEAIEIKAAKL